MKLLAISPRTQPEVGQRRKQTRKPELWISNISVSKWCRLEEPSSKPQRWLPVVSRTKPSNSNRKRVPEERDKPYMPQWCHLYQIQPALRRRKSLTHSRSTKTLCKTVSLVSNNHLPLITILPASQGGVWRRSCRSATWGHHQPPAGGETIKRVKQHSRQLRRTKEFTNFQTASNSISIEIKYNRMINIMI